MKQRKGKKKIINEGQVILRLRGKVKCSKDNYLSMQKEREEKVRCLQLKKHVNKR